MLQLQIAQLFEGLLRANVPGSNGGPSLLHEHDYLLHEHFIKSSHHKQLDFLKASWP
jgi:hypothetical protein